MALIANMALAVSAMSAAVESPAPSSHVVLCTVPDTVGGDPCNEPVEVNSSGTICFMPDGGYAKTLECTWRIHCGDPNIAPAFTLTQLNTGSAFDRVSVYDYNREPCAVDGVTPIESLFEKNNTAVTFEGHAGGTLSIVFSTGENSGPNGRGQGFAGEYSCLDRCVHPNVTDCGEHGSCTPHASMLADAGMCACMDGWSGERCEQDPCQYPTYNDCSGHGDCHDNRECLCDQYYSGVMCEVADLCEVPVHIDCGDHGSCDGGICMCIDNWGGDRCERDPCEHPEPIECGANGSCSTGICTCIDGFAGEHCEHDLCEYPAPMECGPHSQCMDGGCTCDAGWSDVGSPELMDHLSSNNCGGVLRNSGEIAQHHYHSAANCGWGLFCDSGQPTLTFTDFVMDATCCPELIGTNHDVVTIYDVTGSQLGQFESNTVPPPQVAPLGSNMMMVRFVADGSSSGPGFTATFSCDGATEVQPDQNTGCILPCCSAYCPDNQVAHPDCDYNGHDHVSYNDHVQRGVPDCRCNGCNCGCRFIPRTSFEAWDHSECIDRSKEPCNAHC
eukprot:SAG11_NODE_2144_length_3754_cov_2.328591_1_plen_557_part_00